MAIGLDMKMVGLRTGDPLPSEYFPRDVLEDDPEIRRLGDLDEGGPESIGVREVSSVRVKVGDSIHLRDHYDNLALEVLNGQRMCLIERHTLSLEDVKGAEFIGSRFASGAERDDIDSDDESGFEHPDWTTPKPDEEHDPYEAYERLYL